jgi:hypothetical protein
VCQQCICCMHTTNSGCFCAVLCRRPVVPCRAREEVRKRVNMSQWQDKPIVAVVSRLTPQKGVHLIKHAAYKVSWAHTRM